METDFPESAREERHLNKALELLETEKVISMLAKNNIHREAKVIRHDFRSTSVRWWMAAAAVLLITASVFIFKNISQPTSQQLADNSLSSVVNDYNFSYRSSSAGENLIEFQKAFNNSQWSVAEQHLDAALEKTIVTDSNTIMTIYFYKGIVDLQQKDFNAAVINFTPVVSYSSGAFQKDAVWLRGLAHIENNNVAAAKIDLQMTSQIKGWKKADEATEILKSLKNEK